MTFLWAPISPPTHMTEKFHELAGILQGLNFHLKKNLNRPHDRKCEILVGKVERHLTLVPLEKIDQTQYFKKRFLPLESTLSGLPNQLSTETQLKNVQIHKVIR